jgi:hypothetical protein
MSVSTGRVAVARLLRGTAHSRARARPVGAIVLAGLIASGIAGRGAFAAGEQIVVTTDPPLSQIHPHGGPSAGLDPDKLIIQVKDASGRLIPNVVLDVQMDTPATNWFVSTDVPRIEGTTVLKWRGVSADGRQTFAYTFPIRGAYHLSVKASSAPGSTTSFSSLSKETDISIAEKPSSTLYLLLFLAALLTFGVVSGAVLGRAAWAGRRPAT